MRVERPRGHDGIVAGLWRAAADGRMHHALLFEGPRGVGRFLAAQWLAAGLVCERGPGEPCGECGPCRRVASDNHPDLLVIDAGELGREAIPIGAIVPRPESSNPWPLAPISDFLSLRALEGRHRCVLVREAQRLNIAAQNALLKTLEEPAPGTLLVLESDRPERLLDTVRSRCARVRCGALAAQDAAAVLAAHAVEPEAAARLARWSGGSPGAALAFASKAGEEQVALVLGVLSGAAPPLVASRAVFELEGEFEGDKPTRRARDRVRTVLDLALAVVGDVLRARSGAPLGALAFGVEAARVTAADAARVASTIDALLTCRSDVDHNVTPEALVDRAFLSLGDLAAVPSV